MRFHFCFVRAEIALEALWVWVHTLFGRGDTVLIANKKYWVIFYNTSYLTIFRTITDFVWKKKWNEKWLYSNLNITKKQQPLSLLTQPWTNIVKFRSLTWTILCWFGSTTKLSRIISLCSIGLVSKRPWAVLNSVQGCYTTIFVFFLLLIL